MSQLTSLQKVKTYMGISTSSSDAQISALIDGISAQVEDFCGRTFERGTFTKYFNTNGHDSYFNLDNTPVQQLNSVQRSNQNWADMQYSDFNAQEYILENEDNGGIQFSTALSRGSKYLKVSYVGGYLIDWDNESDPLLHTLPAGLSQTVTEMVGTVLNTGKASGITSETTEGQSVTYDSSVKDVMSNNGFIKKLTRYKVFNI